MLDSNTTELTNPSSFILMGIPGLERAHIWISIPFCTMYAIALVGNITTLWIVRVERSLHEPMYYFLCMLAIIDMILPTSTVPKMLSIFWFNSREINFSACLTQLYFFHCFLAMESGILVALAFDRYVAVCDPLRHSVILTDTFVAKIGLAILMRGSLLLLPSPFVARFMPYCRTSIIAHTFCEALAVLKLACADVHIVSYYGLVVTFLVNVPDTAFITFSYTQILRAIFRLPTKEARLKTFGTCSSHFSVILAFYVPGVFSFLMHVFGQNMPLQFHIISSNVYFLVSPMLNPIIYSVRTKQIRDRLLQFFVHKRI